jgi:hypothetical protein
MGLLSDLNFTIKTIFYFFLALVLRWAMWPIGLLLNFAGICFLIDLKAYFGHFKAYDHQTLSADASWVHEQRQLKSRSLWPTFWTL